MCRVYVNISLLCRIKVESTVGKDNRKDLRNRKILQRINMAAARCLIVSGSSAARCLIASGEEK